MPRLIFVGSFLLACVVSASAQSSTATAAGPQRDPSAITFLTQAATTAGGSSSISAVQDFTAQGIITHFWDDNPEQGQLTVKSRGSSQFRIDSSLPEGTWSWIVNNGSGEIAFPDGTTKALAYHNLLGAGSLTCPIATINAALLDQTASIVDLGLIQFGSGQARDIVIQQNLQSDPNAVLSKLTRREYFFDPSSFMLLRTSDTIHPDNDVANGAIKRVLDFANYQSVNGLIMPFSVQYALNGQQIWKIQFSSITFNSGLSDADFQF